MLLALERILENSRLEAREASSRPAQVSSRRRLVIHGRCRRTRFQCRSGTSWFTIQRERATPPASDGEWYSIAFNKRDTQEMQRLVRSAPVKPGLTDTLLGLRAGTEAY